MKAIVTGGLGFIGSNLVDLLLDMKYEIIIIDNMSTNVVNDKFFKNCNILVENISKCEYLYTVDKSIDIVFHLAAVVGPAGIIKHAGNMGASILNDTITVRDFCIRSEALFVDISTSEIYGHTELLDENSLKIFPGEYKVRTEYGAGKMTAEIATVNKAKVNNFLKYHIIRPFNVAGIRQQPDGGFVLPRFIISALTGQPLTVFGTGKQERAFTDVRDICNTILLIVNSKYKNEIWNIGNIKNRMTIMQLAKLVIKKTKEYYPEKKYEIITINPKKIHGPLFSEAIDKVPYTKKLEDKLNWLVNYSINDTLNDLIKFYDNKIKQGYYFRVM